MPRTIYVTKEPCVLDGFQAILKPSQFGYCLSTVITDEDLIERLTQERDSGIEWAKSKLKNPKRAVVRPEPWEELETGGGYKVKFTWKEGQEPPIVDSEGSAITDTSLPLYSGSKVRLGFHVKTYILKDNVTIGTSLKLTGIQVVSVASGSLVDSGPASAADAATMFGKIEGFTISESNVRLNAAEAEEAEEEEALPF